MAPFEIRLNLKDDLISKLLASKQQNGEIFKRIKITTLVQLIIQVAEFNSLNTLKNAEFDSQRTLTNTDRSQKYNKETTRSTLQSVICGVGEMDAYKNYQNRFLTTSTISFNEYNERPYLIVDLRNKDEFKVNHIKTAHHYPATMLSRCSNNESNELLIYKNQKDKIIILYDEDERIVLQAIKIMIERGYNNLFLLSGGLKYAVRKFPHGLLIGTYPISWTLSNSPQKRLIKSNHQESTIRTSFRSIMTFNSNEEFTNNDIEELNTQLNKNLIPTDSVTRLSYSIPSKQSSRLSNFSSISDKPWKP